MIQRPQEVGISVSPITACLARSLAERIGCLCHHWPEEWQLSFAFYDLCAVLVLFVVEKEVERGYMACGLLSRGVTVWEGEEVRLAGGVGAR